MKSQSGLGLLGMIVMLLVTVSVFVGGFGVMIAAIEDSQDISQQHATATVEAEIVVDTQPPQIQVAIQPTPGPVSFSQDIFPILESRCVYCHGPNSIAGAPPNGLELNTYENVMRGSLFFPVIQPGFPENSTIILLLGSGGMPAQSEPLPEEQIELIARWIEEGALNN